MPGAGGAAESGASLTPRVKMASKVRLVMSANSMLQSAVVPPPSVVPDNGDQKSPALAATAAGGAGVVENPLFQFTAIEDDYNPLGELGSK